MRVPSEAGRMSLLSRTIWCMRHKRIKRFSPELEVRLVLYAKPQLAQCNTSSFKGSLMKAGWCKGPDWSCCRPKILYLKMGKCISNVVGDPRNVMCLNKKVMTH